MPRVTYTQQRRDDVYQLWYANGRNASQTLRVLKDEHQWSLSRKSLYAWIAKYDWVRRADAQANIERQEAESQLVGRERILTSLVQQKQRYDRYFNALPDNEIDNAATAALTNLSRVILSIQQDIDRQRSEAGPVQAIERKVPAFEPWLKEARPKMTWTWPHLVYIRAKLAPVIDHLGLVARGETAVEQPKNIILSVPPRHGKSEQVTVPLPAYVLERWPELRVMVGAYSADLAGKFSRKTRKLASERLVNMAADRNTTMEWETTEGGGLRAVGVGGGVTGHGAQLIVVDDPVKSRAESLSPTYREKVWSWFTDDLYTRLEPGGVCILIMTRWHADDLAGRIQDSEFAGDWEVVNLPALAEEDDPLGRKPGEALCPERYTRKALLNRKKVLGDHSFESLFQGHPTLAEGDIIQMEWFKRYKTAPADTIRITQSWDTGSKKGANNDPSVCETWAETDHGHYLLDVYRKRMEYPELKRAAKSLAEQWQPDEILIEDASSGMALIQDLNDTAGFRYPVIAIRPDCDKVTRMSVESPAIEAGLVWLPESAPWLVSFEQECTEFPAGAHDDQVDPMSQYLRRAKDRARAPGVTALQVDI